MSKGNPVIACRVSKDLMKAIEFQIAQRNIFTKGVAWNKADFLEAAIVEKLAKMKRSREKTGRAAVSGRASQEAREQGHDTIGSPPVQG